MADSYSGSVTGRLVPVVFEPPVPIYENVYGAALFSSMVRRFRILASKHVETVHDLVAIVGNQDENPGARHAARLLISIFDSRAELGAVERFDLRQAWACWDDEHRAAYKAWVASGPFWL